MVAYPDGWSKWFYAFGQSDAFRGLIGRHGFVACPYIDRSGDRFIAFYFDLHGALFENKNATMQELDRAKNSKFRKRGSKIKDRSNRIQNAYFLTRSIQVFQLLA